MTALFDYHIHTVRCKHATGAMEEYVQAGIQKGLSEMGFADHLPKPIEGPSPWNMAPEELPLYVAEVKALRLKFPQIPLRLGVEADYIPGAEPRLKELLGQQALDYVLGSVHYLPLGPDRPLKAETERLWSIDSSQSLDVWKGRDVDEVYREYYRVLRQAASSGLFDVIGHADVLKKYGVFPQGDLRGEYRQTAKAFKSAGVLVELNTSGLRKPAKEIYPCLDFLKALRDAGVGITLGSDAHSPGEVALAFQEALAWARQAGFDSLWRWSGPGRFQPVKIS